MGFPCSQNVNKEIIISALAEYMERASGFTREALFIYSDHRRMIEMTESKRCLE